MWNGVAYGVHRLKGSHKDLVSVYDALSLIDTSMFNFPFTGM